MMKFKLLKSLFNIFIILLSINILNLTLEAFTYNVTLFTPPANATNVKFNAINNRGEAVGQAINPTKQSVGILGYSNGTVVYISDLTQSICGPAGQAFGLYGINDYMQITGLCNYYPFRYSFEEGIVILTENGNQFSFGARAINNAGQVAGNGDINGFDGNNALVFLMDDEIVNLGSLIHGDSYPHSYAYGINDVQLTNGFGEVVGESESSYSSNQAFLYTNGTLLNIGQIMFEGVDSIAYQINNHGVVAGKGYPGGYLTAFIYDSKSGSYETFLGYVFLAINDEGWAVGTNQLYANGVFYNLDNFMPSSESSKYTFSAQDINDKGQILVAIKTRSNSQTMGYGLLKLSHVNE